MAGKHRKPSRLKVTLHATSGTVASAAVVGVVATTAQVAIVHAPGHVSAAAPIVGSSAAAAVTAAPKPAGPKPAVPKVSSAPKTQPKKAFPVAPPKAGQPKAPAAPPKAVAPAPKKIKAADVIKLAQSQVGIAEDGSGETKFQDWYMSTNRAKETVKRDGGTIQGYEAAAWCSMFISWLGERLGFADQLGADAWTIAHAEWFQQQGRWGSKPIPGAVAFFDWGGGKTLEGIDHVGLVVKDNGDGTIQTIEGNTADAVKVRERSISTSVVGFGYPDYAK